MNTIKLPEKIKTGKINTKIKTDVMIHLDMSMVGGMFGAYALLCRNRNFGSAQTGNLIYLVLRTMDGNWQECAIRVGALLIYSIFIALSYLLPRYTKRDVRQICLGVEVVGVLITGMIPGEINQIAALYPVFAMTALQWGSFSGTKEYYSASVFSTNNLKQVVISGLDYLQTKDEVHIRKFRFFLVTLLSFHIGVVLGAIVVNQWSERGIWWSLLLLSAALVLLKIEDENEKILCNKCS